MKLMTEQLNFLLSELDKIIPIVPISDEEVAEIEAEYIPPEFSQARLKRDAGFLEELLQEWNDTGVPSS